MKDLTQLDLTTLFLNRKDEERIDESNFLKRIKAIGIELGITENIKTQSFRKYFRTMITRIEKESKITKDFREHLTGHKGENLSGGYNRDLQNIEMYYKEWLKCEACLSVDYQIIDKTDEEVLKLKEENQKVNARLELEIQHKIALETQVQALQKQVEQIVKTMNLISDNAVQSVRIENKEYPIDDPQLADAF